MIIAIGFLLSITGIVLMHFGYQESKPTDKNIASKIANCFSDVKFETNSFQSGGAFMVTSTGEKYFYPKNEVDKGIKCLNELIADLRVTD